MHAVHDVLAAMDLNLVVALDVLLAERHVTRAAQRLGITQSAASHALGRLRELLGDPLLVRGPGGAMVPSTLALRIAPQLRKVLEDLAGVLRGETFDPATARRTFRLGGSDYVELVLLPRLAARLARLAPGVDLWVHNFDDWGDAELATGKLDCVLAPPRRNARPSGMFEKILLHESFTCVMRAGHPLAGARLTLARYCEAPHLMVAPRGTPGSIVDDALAAAGRTRRVALAVPHFLVVPYVIAATDLVATLANRIAALFATTLDLVMVPPPIAIARFAIAVAWHERNHHDAAQRWFRDQIAAVATEELAS
ncbi:MAG TPA: LysR family transcriptional regulator [Kofleriaceae bacterium]|nr:LysR family transcriptional regulator [Kofleriaceae bacterium]